jgi:hypothetical protein
VRNVEQDAEKVGSVTMSASVSPGCIGRSPESRQPLGERFQTVPWPWNGPAWYVTEQCAGNQRKGRSEKGTDQTAKKSPSEDSQFESRSRMS